MRLRNSKFNTTLNGKGLRRLHHRLYEEIPIRQIGGTEKEAQHAQRQAVAFFCFFIIPVSIFMVPMMTPQAPDTWSALH